MSASNTNRKTVLITGCSPGGIGHELAKEYQAKGLRVIATARNPVILEDLAALGLETFELDVTQTGSVQAGGERVVSMTGGTITLGKDIPFPPRI
ncbi:hypothetical protein FB451DRAFT_1275656 [Mycena latifolia]|nr:hypothetical protein FB451DRAFT_1275656 [Mycena latifolia]